jgi:hypothetical protein
MSAVSVCKCEAHKTQVLLSMTTDDSKLNISDDSKLNLYAVSVMGHSEAYDTEVLLIMATDDDDDVYARLLKYVINSKQYDNPIYTEIWNWINYKAKTDPDVPPLSDWKSDDLRDLIEKTHRDFYYGGYKDTIFDIWGKKRSQRVFVTKVKSIYH